MRSRRHGGPEGLFLLTLERMERTGLVTVTYLDDAAAAAAAAAMLAQPEIPQVVMAKASDARDLAAGAGEPNMETVDAHYCIESCDGVVDDTLDVAPEEAQDDRRIAVLAHAGTTTEGRSFRGGLRAQSAALFSSRRHPALQTQATSSSARSLEI